MFVQHFYGLVVFQGYLVKVSGNVVLLNMVRFRPLYLVNERVGECELVESDHLVVVGLVLQHPCLGVPVVVEVMEFAGVDYVVLPFLLVVVVVLIVTL